MGANKAARGRLRTMIAACKGFRAYGGVATPWDNAPALTHVHIGALPSPAANAASHSATELANFRPFALIWTEDAGGLQYQQTAVAGTSGKFKPGGILIARFEKLVDAADAEQPGVAEENFVDELDDIIATYVTPFDAANAGLFELHGEEGSLAFNSLELMGPTRATEEQKARHGDYIRAWLEFRWGIM